MRKLLLVSALFFSLTCASAQDAHLQQGVVYFKQQQYRKALEEFHQAHSVQPRNATIDNLIGITNTKLGKLDEANQYYQLAIQLKPGDAGPHRNLGVNYLSAKDYAAAEKELIAAEEIDPQSPFAHYYLATLYLETSRDLDAAKQFEPARQLLENDPGLLFLMASAYLRLDQKPQAIALIHDLEERSSLNVDQEYKLGVLLTAKQMYPEAVERFRNIVRMQPASWNSKFNLAIALINLNQLQEAITVLQPLTAERARDARLFTLLGSLYEATGNFPKALSSYASAVQDDPDNPDRYLDYTRLLMDLDRYGEAARIVQQGIKDTPDAYALNLRMGSIEMTQGQYAQARQSFEKAIQEHPEITLGYIALAQGYMREGKDQEASDVLTGARKELPPDAMLEYLYGLVLSHLSQKPEAIAALQRSVSLNPQVAESHYELGRLYLQSGQIQQAQAEFERVIELAPQHANGHYQLSQIYARLGETEKSKAMAAQTQALLQKQREEALRVQKARLGSFQPPPVN